MILSVVDHPLERRVAAHGHELTLFSLLLRGSYRETVGNRTVEYRPLSVGFHPAGTEHRDEVGRGGALLFGIELGAGWVERLRDISPRGAMAWDHGGELARCAVRLHHELRHSDSCSRLAIEGLALELLAGAGRSRPLTERGRPQWLETVADRLRDEFADPPCLEEIASDAGVHPAHLARTFRRAYAMSIGEFVRAERVRFVSERLARSDDSLSTIALAAGFSDQSHCARVFRGSTGSTPTDFRRALRGTGTARSR